MSERPSKGRKNLTEADLVLPEGKKPQFQLGAKILALYGKVHEEARVLDIYYDSARDAFDYWIHYENFHARYDRWLQPDEILEMTAENQMRIHGINAEGRVRREVKPTLIAPTPSASSDRKRKRTAEIRDQVLAVEDELEDMTVLPDPSLVPVPAGSSRSFSNGVVHDLYSFQLRFPAQLRRILVIDLAQMTQNNVWNAETPVIRPN